MGFFGCSPTEGGNTNVEETLPILALKADGSPRPRYAVEDDGGSRAMPPVFYQGWACGRIALTPPIKGIQIASPETADAYCREHCGEGYRMAEWHDARFVPGMDLDESHGDTWPPYEELKRGGWSFWAYGDIPDGARFWVRAIGAQVNCWDE